MIADIRKHLEISPFQPFALRTADGREYAVPTVDHIYVPPGAKRVVITDDRGITVAIPPLFITGLVQGVPAAEAGSDSQGS